MIGLELDLMIALVAPFYCIYSSDFGSAITVNYLDTSGSCSCSLRRFSSSSTASGLSIALCDHISSGSSIGISGIGTVLVLIFASLRWLASLVFFFVIMCLLFEYQLSAGFRKAHLASSEEVYVSASFLSDTLSLSDQFFTGAGG